MQCVCLVTFSWTEEIYNVKFFYKMQPSSIVREFKEETPVHPKYNLNYLNITKMNGN